MQIWTSTIPTEQKLHFVLSMICKATILNHTFFTLAVASNKICWLLCHCGTVVIIFFDSLMNVFWDLDLSKATWLNKGWVKNTHTHSDTMKADKQHWSTVALEGSSQQCWHSHTILSLIGLSREGKIIVKRRRQSGTGRPPVLNYCSSGQHWHAHTLMCTHHHCFLFAPVYFSLDMSLRDWFSYWCYK